MKAIAAYMASRTSSPERQEYENRSEYGGHERQPNQYPQRNTMGGYWPENNDQRGGGDGRGREMNDYGGAESRYRGRDGRWHAGRRRSEYDGGMYGYDTVDRRMGDDEEERKKYSVTVQPKNVIEWPYGPHEPPESRMIGFGAQDNMDMQRSQEPVEHGDYRMGEMAYMPVFDRETAEEWVRSMRNEDKNHPHGGKWTAEALKPMAQKYNIPTEGKRFWEFYAMTNAMYSDYSEIARKFGITSPEFYACMAKAFMDDRDAVPDKVAMYYEYITKK